MVGRRDRAFGDYPGASDRVCIELLQPGICIQERDMRMRKHHTAMLMAILGILEGWNVNGVKTKRRAGYSDEWN